MGIRHKLFFNTSIIIVCLGVVGGIGFFYTHHVARMSMSLVEIEAVPILEINSLEESAWEMWLRLVVHTSVSDVETMQGLETEITQLEEKLKQQIIAVAQLYQTFDTTNSRLKLDGEQEHLQTLKQFQQNWQNFSEIAHNVLKLSQEFTKEDAVKLIVHDGRVAYDGAIANLRTLIKQHRLHMETLRDIALNARQQSAVTIIALTVLIGLTVLFLINNFSRRLLTPLLKINTQLKLLAQGQLLEDEIEYKGNDEIGEIVLSSQRLKESMRSTIIQANAIAAGNYNSEVQLLSEQDELGHALVDMTNTLRQVTQKTTTQDWLKTGQNQLNDQMSGEQNLVDLGHNIISFITIYVEAQIGVFYLVEQATQGFNQNLQLKLIASYAYTKRKNLADEFQFSEGLVERAAKEQQSIILTINSGLSEEVPRHIIVIPFPYENLIKGVIVLGSAVTLTTLQIDFLHQVMPNIGIAVNSIESRSKMQELLQQTQIQANELQHQKAELQQQKEELQHQKEVLQHQTEELQSQAEELQSQTEELRQTNEELEERTQELERQREAVRIKNNDLEDSRRILEIKAEELELASQYKSEFLANMSHELRTPLNSLLILSQLLAENKANNLTDKQIEYAQTIHSAGADLLTLINDILDLSKVEAGKVEVHPEDILLTDLVENIDQKFRHVAEERKLAFQLTIAENLPPKIYTDGQRLIQVINNLLSNAFKFTAAGQVKLTIQRPADKEWVSPTGLTIKKPITFSVEDTGIGIPLDKQKVIFEAFQQADGTTSRRYGGTGLGLSISRQLARLLGGELHLSSQEGKGSIFTLYLPESIEPNGPIFRTEKAKPEPAVVHSARKMTTTVTPSTAVTSLKENKIEISDDRANLQPGDKFILIIEDDRKFATILVELAREKEFKCLFAEDGKTGLQLAEKYHPHAIILDVGLPLLDGWTVMEQLKDNPNTRHIPVHFMSATEQGSEAKKMGAIGYLLKPISMAELGDAFKKIEQFLAKTVKNLLVLVDNPAHQEQILNLVGSNEVQATVVTTKTKALQQLTNKLVDTIILDLDIDQGTGIHLLEQLQSKDEWSQIPVIIHANRDLTEFEETIFQRCSGHLIVKAVRSPERLLDEATLFLHQIEANLPEEKRNMLKMVHDKTAILIHKKVLIVDDDIRNTFALATVLEDHDVEVKVAQNGKEALTVLEEHPEIDIVLMDIMMPEMDGYEAMQKIRAQPRFRKLPIIALTAKAMKGDRAKCIEAGANDYLSKPVDTDKLISLMRVWLYQ
ncbi:signal transduction histidine kinase [Thioploca ingrica]|uniref:histidine kinase n=1 Tax=Thioploca ingrica TaxID=40754 RepID=A0A090AN23_9GAMM|nr:signal transduction histidine kinase [Thioploca ingrica]